MNKVNYLLLLLFINNIKYIIGGTVYFEAFQFKNALNPDFGIQYGSVVPNVADPNTDLGLTIAPRYCCDNFPTTNNEGTVIVHNSSTFDYWWRPDTRGYRYFPYFDRFDCGNYRFKLRASTEVLNDEDQEGSIVSISISQQEVIDSLAGIGFNNATAYPEYSNDAPEQELFCFDFTGYLLRTSSEPGVKYTIILEGAEFVLGYDDKIIYQNIGAPTGFIYIELGDQDERITLFACIRDPNAAKDIRISFVNAVMRCNLDQCNVCGSLDGSNACEEYCPNYPDPTQLSTQAFGCGICANFYIDCEDGDFCTEEYFQPGEGCQYINHCTEDPETTSDLTIDPTTTSDITDDLTTTIDITTEIIDTTTEDVTTTASTIITTIASTSASSIISTSASTIVSTVSSTSASTFASTTSEITTQSSTIDITTIASTSASSISSTSASTSASTISSTIASTSASTLASTTETTTSHITTISDSTLSSSSSSSNSITTNKPPQFNLCDSSSCLDHYCCIQLSTHSYTCISKYFEQNCSPDKLKSFY